MVDLRRLGYISGRKWALVVQGMGVVVLGSDEKGPRDILFETTGHDALKYAGSIWI